jgi:ubiquinone/menaquinone biosynthesis C-methylase UbiE
LSSDLEVNHYQDAKYLKADQYRNSRNLGARAQLHELYGSNPMGWFTWVLNIIGLNEGESVLECGCGPGWLWQKNLDHLPDGCEIILTDLSPGMVAEAKAALAPAKQGFRFREADISDLPYENDRFDVVIANHMLYHVADRKRALAEVRRVLRPEGRFLAATVGKNHMLELRELRRRFLPNQAEALQRSGIGFSLENGERQLSEYFSQVELALYSNRLEVTDSRHLVNYALSSTEARQAVGQAHLESAVDYIRRQIKENGYFEINTDSGIFKAEG